MKGWPIHVISMRPDFWSRLSSRANELQLFPTRWAATDGKSIDVAEWERSGHFALSRDPAQRPMTRGEIGCSDSHQRVWSHIASVGFDGALVLEDDADLPADLPAWMEKAQAHCNSWDVLFLGYTPWATTVPAPDAPGFVVPDIADQWHVLHAYMVTRAGAAKLLQDARPIRIPIDLHVARRTRWGLRVWQTETSQVGVREGTFSSTQGIR